MPVSVADIRERVPTERSDVDSGAGGFSGGAGVDRRDLQLILIGNKVMLADVNVGVGRANNLSN